RLDILLHREPILKAFEATGIWPMDANVILRLSDHDWRKLDRLVRAAVNDSHQYEARKLRSSVHHLSVHYELLKHENEGLKEALQHKKKHRKKGKALDLQQRQEYHGGSVFWSPRKLREARAREAVRERDETEEKLQKARSKKQREEARLQRQDELEERRVERQRLKEMRELERAEKAAERARQKEERDAAKAIQLPQKGKGELQQLPHRTTSVKNALRLLALVLKEGATECPTPHTRSEEPESPINTDLRGNKRRQRAHTRAEPSIGSTAPTSYNQAVSEAVRQRIQAAQKATNLHHSIITDLATAVDRCLGKYTDPDGARVAKDLQQKVLRAINTSLITPLITPPNSGSDSDTTHRSWADVARTLKNPTPPARGAATTKAATAAPKQLAQTPRRPLNTDNRILIAVGAEARLQRASPFAARMAIVKAIKEITPSDIPTAKHIKTGWAITPRNDKIKALLMGQENRELMIRAVEGESARLPERWVNYAVQGVESSYRTITGENRDRTGELPASRHGPTEGRTTWIISFTRPVRSFRLFGTGDYAHEIKKNSPAMLHDPGCLGYCKTSRCTRPARCTTCSKTTATHQGPHGEQCKDTPKCANCHGPFPATHDKCPAAPTRANGRLIQPTKGELKVIREAGDRASEAMQPARGRQTGSTVETSIEITDGDIANTTEPVGTPTDASKRSRQDVNNLNTATVREPATTLGTRRSKRTAATTQDLNLARMSARSVQPSTADQDPNTSSSEHADTEMSLGSSA
ncbi:hypothetical protein Ptr86124_001422, partial [Pyrenophora tritici-repentis]